MSRRSAGLHLWLADLTALGKCLDELEAREQLLSPAERRRARERSAIDAAGEWRRARITLRLLLARSGMPDPRTPLAPERGGFKPRPAGGGPEVSISHTAGFALIGVFSAGAIGVDLERARKLRVSAERERLLLAAGEALRRGTGARNSGVVSAWVRLEALGKALGCGVGATLTAIGLAGPPSRLLSEKVVAARAARLAQDAGYRVCDLRLPARLLGAVAVPAALRSIPAVVPLEADDCKLAAAWRRTDPR